MKRKLLIMSCIAALCLTFAACGKEEAEPEKDTSSKDSAVSVSADEQSGDDADNEPAEDTSSEEESKPEDKPDEGESKADDEPVDDGTAAEIISRMVDNVNSTKTCIMNAKMDMTGYLSMTYAGESMEQDMKQIMEAEITTTKKGQHSVNKNTSNDGYGDEIDTEDIYFDFATGVSYTSYDEGKTWYKSVIEPDKDGILNLDTIFESKEALETAEVEKSADGYIITVDITKVEKITEGLTGSISGVEFSGNFVITIDKDYYPVTIEMKDMKFDTSSFIEMLTAMGGDLDEEIDVTFDLNLSFIMTYSNWNDVSDDLVTPSDDIVSKAIEE